MDVLFVCFVCLFTFRDMTAACYYSVGQQINKTKLVNVFNCDNCDPCQDQLIHDVIADFSVGECEDEEPGERQ